WTTRMKGFIFLVMNLAVSSTFSLKNTPTFQKWTTDDILEINHGKDDIMVSKFLRSSVSDVNRLWTSPIAYVLDESLEINAKAVILNAFEQFRLKSCIDFKLRDSEEDYIIVKKLGGCFSYVGKVSGEQVLSIGRFCDEISTVEHEFLHALGFDHEHNRFDRDNFVTIDFDNILTGLDYNFDKVNGEDYTDMGVPYDYWSVMHYGKFAFSNGNGTTINSKDPNFEDVIGQRRDMSPSDTLELNRRYKCNLSLAFKMYCGFSKRNMCQMKHCSNSDVEWELVTRAEGGPYSDHTNLPTGLGHRGGRDDGYFMHASTVSGRMGDSALLETQRMTTTRKCNVKCLQFYYYHSGHESDDLNIWIREFQSKRDSEGSRRLMGQITGLQTFHWRLHYVTLTATKDFQVEFEIVKGAGISSGGFSIDDINLSETECPHGVMQLNDVVKTFNTTTAQFIFGPKQYTQVGYAYRIVVAGYDEFVGMGIQLVSGKYDDQLEWPCPYRQVVLQIVDQTPDLQLHMSKELTFTTDPNVNTSAAIVWYDDPRKTGDIITTEKNETFYAGPVNGFFMLSFENLISRDFIKGGNAMFAYRFQDITPLVNGSKLPCNPWTPMKITYPPRGVDYGSCSSRILPTKQPTTDDSIFSFSPTVVASPVLTILLALMLMMR
ncbi:meprin A subunit beta-like, partial [Solea senegalensis]